MTVPTVDRTLIPAPLSSTSWQWPRASHNCQPPSTAPRTASALWQTLGSAGVTLGCTVPPAATFRHGMHGDSRVSQFNTSSESPRSEGRNSPRRTLSGATTQSDVVRRQVTDVRRSLRHPSSQSERIMGKSSHGTPDGTPEKLAKQLDGSGGKTNKTGRCLSNPPLLQGQSANILGPIVPARDHTHSDSVSPQTPFRAGAPRELQRTLGPTGSLRTSEPHQDSASLTVCPGGEPVSSFSTFVGQPVLLSQPQASPRRCNKVDDARRSPSSLNVNPAAKRLEGRHSSGRSSPPMASLSWVQPPRPQTAALETASLNLSLETSPRIFRESSPCRPHIVAQQEGNKLPVFGSPSRSVLNLPQMAHVSRSLTQKATCLQ